MRKRVVHLCIYVYELESVFRCKVQHEKCKSGMEEAFSIGGSSKAQLFCQLNLDLSRSIY